MIPVRCFTCGAVIGDKWEEFARSVEQGDSPREILDRLGVDRYCCRRMLMSHVGVLEEILRFYEKSGSRTGDLDRVEV
jgi:DNA-directed RNA polymerase subunit N